MEVHLRPETESRIQELAAKTGRATDELVEDAMAGYLEELAQTRAMLGTRYEELKRGTVRPLDGEEAFSTLRRMSNVAIPATDLATDGTASVVATNPGGPASNTLTITIQ